jgi:DNA-binding CsgD family transcriptional regulator
VRPAIPGLGVEAEALHAVLARRRGALVPVEGHLGTGKTAVLAYALGLGVATGYAVASGLDGPAVAGVDQLPMVADEPGLPRLRGWLRDRQALGGPVLVVLDDLHQLPAASAHVLAALPAHHRSGPVVWVLGRTTGLGGPELDRLFDTARPDAVRVTLDPLTDDGTAELLAELLGRPPSARLVSAAAVAGGHRLLTIALVEGLRQEGRLAELEALGAAVHGSPLWPPPGPASGLPTEPAAAPPELDWGTAFGHQPGAGYEPGRAVGPPLVAVTGGPAVFRLPRRVAEVVAALLRQLTPDCRQFLQVAALGGARFAVRDVAADMDRGVGALLPAVTEAVEAGLLHGGADHLAFTQPLLQHALVESVPPSVRKALTPGALPPALAAVRRRDRVAAAHPAAPAGGLGPPPAPAAPAGGLGPPVAWGRLSETERSIAVLAGGGLTNRQIGARICLSPHTVNYHLRKVFRKLDVRSRIELAQLVPAADG